MNVTNVIVVIPDANTGHKLCAYLRNKYKVGATLWRDTQGLADAEADVFIVYRKSLGSLQSLQSLSGRVAILYGNMPIPPEDRGFDYAKLTGTLPGCVCSFMETVSGQTVTDLTWGENPEDEIPDPDGIWTPVRSVALFSPGGGVGKTTTAVHLAKLAEQAHINVGIVETDEDKGGVLRYLGRQPAQEGLDSLGKADWENEELFRESVESVIQKVGRIQVVPMVGTFNGLSCDIENVSFLYRWAASRFTLTVYDLPPRLRDAMTVSVLQEADVVVLVAEPTDVLMDALQKHLKLCREVEQFAELPKKYRLLVNKVPKNEGLNPEEMANALALPLLGAVPVDTEHYAKIINRAKFDIPVDSPWRSVYANLGIENTSSLVPINREIRNRKGGVKPKERRGLFRFFLGA